VRRAPAFWRQEGVAPRLLAPAALIYGALAARRLRRPGPRATLPTIVIGGLTAGGDGKTPLAIALATQLTAMSARPALLTRGYGRRARGDAPVLVDPARHDARDVGDEALLLARVAPTIVSADRLAGVSIAVDIGATILVLDDGFHSRALAPDLAILAIDAEYGAGNGFCLPSGPLRAPLDAQLAAADALVTIGDGAAGAGLARGFDKTVLRARLDPDPDVAKSLAGARVVAFAGVARPEKFFSTLRGLGAELVATRAYADHHVFTPREIADLRALAGAQGARLLTTEKDAARGAGVDSLPVTLAFDDANALGALLAGVLTARQLAIADSDQ
jgi:tetraacyldisaccharide 4'-kinase